MKTSRHFFGRGLGTFALLLAAAAGVGCSTPTFSPHAETSLLRGLAASEEITAPSVLEHEITVRRKRVAEFQFLNEYGKKHGFRIFGAGGTAVGYASYVRQHLENEVRKLLGKSLKYFDTRFDYDYFSVFRATQDADIVIELSNSAGNPLSVAEHEQAAQALESVMKEKYGHLQGSKSVWEVRFLRVDRGVRGEASHKDALLGFDFQNQHTDSYSTGLVELTDPPRGESVVRDVKRWDSKENVFLEDLAEGKIRFYLERNHAKTLRASKGMNPEILSVIRMYTKAFQYGAKIPAAEEAKVLPLIKAFNPETTSHESYIAKQIRNNGLKLYWHAIDVERANLELSKVGLLKKLIEYGKFTDGSVKEASEKLSVWLGRKPLPTRPIGKGPKITGVFAGYEPSFKTAAQLGITIVSHETDQYLAYENITRAARGYPNVFESLASQEGQAAAYGDGWYTKIGREGARETGFTIRSNVHPDAVEGIDFFVSGHSVIFRNRAALQVIDESLSMTPFEFVSMLLSQKGVEKSNRGLYEAASRKVNGQMGRINAEEKKAIRELLLQNINRFDEELVEVWSSQLMSAQFPEVIEQLLKEGTVDLYIAANVLPQPHWSNHPEWVEQLLKKGTADSEIANYVLSQPNWSNQPEFVEHLLKKGTVDSYIVMCVLPQPHWSNHPEWVEQLLKKGTVDWYIAKYVLSQPHWSNHPEWVEQLLKKGTVDAAIAKYVLSQPHWSNHPEWVEHLLKKGTKDGEIALHALSRPHWSNHPVLRAVTDGALPTVENLRAGIGNDRFKLELEKYALSQKVDCKSLVKMKN